MNFNFNFDKIIQKTNKALTKISEKANKVLTKATDEVKNIFEPSTNNNSNKRNNTNIPMSNPYQYAEPTYNFCQSQPVSSTNVNQTQPMVNYPTFEPIVTNINQVNRSENFPNVATPIDEDNFDDLVRVIRKAVNPESQMDDLTKSVSVYSFTAKQARKLMKKITIPFYQIRACLILYPAISDKENYSRMVEVCKDQVKKEIYSQLQTQFNAPPVESKADPNLTISSSMSSSVSSSIYYSDPFRLGPPSGVSNNPYTDYYCPPIDHQPSNEFSILNTNNSNLTSNVNSNCLSDGNFFLLKQRVEKIGFSDKKLEEIKLTLSKCLLKSSHARELVQLIPFDDYQYKTCVFLKDKLSDPENISVMIDGCNFPSTKAKLRNELIK